ncbi:hypothetical protein L1987_57744 [Smallanthus sonchifolius]|uniref:Uncharacterized protein n=1 Tax=Smallanthus sonchifolius TaxID=185202 RepID=A0ACB9DDZ5_9ASTR|nr:hypothetical protein L1987_57744 [Smallanthus sonchifolius]
MVTPRGRTKYKISRTRTQTEDNVFADSLIVSPSQSKYSTPQVTEAYLKEVLDTVNKSKYVPPGLSSSTADKDERIKKDLNEVTYEADNYIEFNPMLLDTIGEIEGSLESEQDVSDTNEESEFIKPGDEPKKLYRNTGMMKAQWIEIKKTWWKEKPTAPPSFTLKSKYVN